MTTLLNKLSEPFEPKNITWKPGATKDNKCLALAYADLRAYQDRLDDVCGLDWHVEYLPWEAGRIIARLTIGTTTRSSTGEHDAQDEKNNMAGTVAEAQAFKRACAMFGLGRYLYDLPSVWTDFDPQRKRITDAGQKELDNRYATWYKRTTAQNAPQATQTQRTPNRTTTPAKTPQRAPGGHSEDVEFSRKKELPKLSEAQHKQLHAIGRTFYGDEWDEQRPKLVQAVSKGAVSSSNDLTPEEADKLIAGITKKINQVEQAKMRQKEAA